MNSFLKFSTLHLFISLLLYLFGQFSFLIVFQLLFFMALFETKNHFVKSMIFFAYLMGLNYALALFFSFESYLLYFASLFGVLYFLYTQYIAFTKKELLACGMFALSILFILRSIEEFIYDIYISLDIVDAQNYIDQEVFSALTLLHLFLLFLILFKKNRRLFGI